MAAIKKNLTIEGHKVMTPRNPGHTWHLSKHVSQSPKSFPV